MSDPIVPRYESTISPAKRHFAGPGASRFLGVRDEEGLAAAFGGTPGATPENPPNAFITDVDQKQAYQRAIDIINNPADFDGPDSNPLFPQYRRNFKPAEGFGDLYTNPRDKNSVDVEAAKLGTPYSPTIASPGEGNGVNPLALRSVASVSTLVLEQGAVPKDNPANEIHKNTDDQKHVDDIGQVRRFKLGVGSGATDTPEGARGQFPR